jgi:carbon-monoxide dehydrogenase medium subunit
MKPASFEYVRAGTVQEALAALVRFDGEARVLAGGQSLMPLMNMRMLRPAGIVDINGIGELAGIRREEGKVVIGALTRYEAIEHSEVVAAHLPLVAVAIRKVADRQVRNRGTLGGSLCHSDPAAQMPLCARTLRATMTVVGPNGRREIPAEEFFVGPYETAVDPLEVLVAISYPDSTGATARLMQQVRRHGDFPTVSIALSAQRAERDTWSNWRIGMCGLGMTARTLDAVAELLEGKRLVAGPDP